MTGFDDNLENLKLSSKKSGGVIAFLPNSENWRDKPEKIPFQKNYDFDVKVIFGQALLWKMKGIVSPHEELLNQVHLFKFILILQ